MSFTHKEFAVGLLILLFLPVFTWSQSNNTLHIVKQFNKHNENAVLEKLFVHVDRKEYLTGEIIWFKAYCINGDNTKLMNLSKVAYIEILDMNQQPIIQAKVALKDGIGSGSVQVPSNIGSGNYLLRAYTNWMKNFGADYFFEQPISIINTLKADTLISERNEIQYHADFFPEGGEMVEELRSKVGFRITDNTGKGIDFKGLIFDESNDTITNFSPAKFGIGNFNFTPKPNKQYKAVITTANGITFTQNLPLAKKAGMVMSVTEKEGSERVRIDLQTNATSNFVYLFIHTGKEVKAAQTLFFTNGTAQFEIDKSALGHGISHITIFDAAYQPICERLFFKTPNSQRLVIEPTTLSTEYTGRQKVTIDLATTDESKNAQAANISLAVYLIDSSDAEYKDIYSYLWLSSDLKGSIESPEYYFKQSNSEISQAIDNLMLTHGWRKFKWKEVLADEKKIFDFLPEYEGHIVSGRILNTKDNTPAADKVGFLSIPGTNFQLYTAKSNNSGVVNFVTKNLHGNKMAIAVAEPDNTSNYRIELSNAFSEDASSVIAPAFNLKNSQKKNLLKRSINMQVQNVFKNSELQTVSHAKVDSPHFYGTPEFSYLLENYTRFTKMEDVLREYVREILVDKKRNNFILSIGHKDEEGQSFIKKPLILLDGVPQFDHGNRITNYDALKVKKIESITSTYYFGPSKFGGIASFLTYKGDLEDFPLDTTALVIDYEALQLRREFYSPKYESQEQKNSRIPDFRNLLFWSPEIQTDDSGRKSISFYTSDVLGKYAVVVQGFSKDGKAGSGTLILDVKKAKLN